MYGSDPTRFTQVRHVPFTVHETIKCDLKWLYEPPVPNAQYELVMFRPEHFHPDRPRTMEPVQYRDRTLLKSPGSDVNASNIFFRLQSLFWWTL